MTTKKILADSVTGSEKDGFDFVCPVNDGTCGVPGSDVSFTSTGWPTRKTAEARGAEHFKEHKGEGLMRSLDDFRAAHGLAQDPGDPKRAVVTAKDL